MDPNQQPNQQPQGYPPQPQPNPPVSESQPQPVAQPQPAQPQPVPAPQIPSNYAQPAPQPTYDPNYLDSIAPPPPAPKFLSGSFGKIFFVLIGVFVLIVRLMVAFSGQDKTADLQQVTVRLQNFSLITKTTHKNIRDNDLSTTNSNFQSWLSGNTGAAEKLLGEGGIKKTDYDKKMVASETKLSDDLTKKFEDARLSARLNTTYANSMAAETAKIQILLNTMAKKSGSAKIRDFAKNASSNLTSIQKSFEDFNEGGNALDTSS